MVDFSDALDKVQKVMDKDTKYQKECDALLDEAQAKDDLAMVLQDEEKMPECLMYLPML